jgi:hypothetical protein
MALAAMGAAAVVGVGSAAAEATPSASEFAGSWSGTWSIPERGLDGTYDWTISDAGRITGRVHHSQSGSDGDVVGNVHDDGSVSLTAFAPNDEPTHGCGFHFQGSAVIDGDGKLVASVIGLGESQSTRPALVATLERN